MRQAYVVPSLVVLCFPLAAATAVAAASPPCRPCAGVHTNDPLAVAAALATTRPLIAEEARLYVAWEVDLAAEVGSAPAEAAAALTRSHATPWLRLVFRTPAPVAENLAALEAELKRAADLARAVSPANHFQVLWWPSSAPEDGPSTADYGFLFKRAAVAVSGAQTEARVLPQPLPAAEPTLRAFYGQEIAAYLDGVALQSAPEASITAAVALLAELDPGRPVVVEGVAFPTLPAAALAWAADLARQGAALAFFQLAAPSPEALAPLAVLANEFQGDLSWDPHSIPQGPAGAWAFVRGEDLGLRVVARPPAGATELVMRFPDPQLRRPARVDPTTGEVVPLAGVQLPDGLEVRVPSPAPIEVLRLERATAAELEGVEEKIDITSEREIPVEEILRRLQAFDDAQARKLDHYQALNTTHLRFQASAGAAGTVEATLEGEFFYRRGEGFDWAWQNLYFNGVRWRGKTLPEIPLIQPEKAAAMPLAIELSKRYVYRLRGSEEVAGRDTWVVEFRPAGEAQGEEEKLFRGTVWVDKQIFARARTRAVQLGLEGEVLSNEETVTFQPVDAEGQAAAWSAESYFLPLNTVAQQIWSVLNTTTVVERQIELSRIAINGAEFEERREATLASEVTMLRDTPQGLRYLVKDETTGERTVKEGFDTNKLFLVGGVFYDDALDYPLPLAGLNYFSFDFRGTGGQLNAFFGGALATVDFAQPRFLGSRWDVGGDAFVFAFPSSDTPYRDGEEVKGEEVESRTGNVSFLIGHPIGDFVKVGLEYELTFDDYSDVDETADDFVLPESTVTHAAELDVRFARSGYQLGLSGSYHRRQDWESWGLPGNTEFDPDQREYQLWQVRASKNWHLPSFQRLSAEVDYFGGQNLDRFSKYQFGFFGGTRVHGYQSGRVRAEEGYAAHLSYGFQVGELFRLEGAADAAWATDELSGLDNELLAGVGIVGQFMGPWQTLVQVDLGTPVAGPDDGFVVYLVFLKLFR